MKFATSAFSVLVVVFVAFRPPGFSQDRVRLELTATKVQLDESEPLDLVVKLQNTSSNPLFVDSSIEIVQLSPYRFQFRAVGENEFKDISQLSRPSVLPIPPPPRSAAEVIVRNRLVPLESNAFIGRIIGSSWRSLTDRSKGDYEIRIVYEGRRPWSPYLLEFPVLETTIVSNTLTLEIR